MELERLSKAGELKSVHWVDYLGSNAKETSHYHFDYEAAEKEHLDDPGTLIDVGFIHIREHYRTLLAANGIVAHDEIQWRKQPERFAIAYLLGIPAATVRSATVSIASFQTSMMPVEILDHRPSAFDDEMPPDVSEEDLAIRDSMFFGRIPADIELPVSQEGRESLKGMSGGPILGFVEAGGSLKYWVIAVQSAWIPGARYIRGTPLARIGAALERNVDEFRSRAT